MSIKLYFFDMIVAVRVYAVDVPAFGWLRLFMTLVFLSASRMRPQQLV
ncbi:MAG: hypothetical protein PHY16_06870 [Methylobacter sp.]|nr:hypothetical protein [Methylobacter sp.]